MKQPHKHAELIKAWADGAEIEFYSNGIWTKCAHNMPFWDVTTEYRIKPEPKPDVVKYVNASLFSMNASLTSEQFEADTLKLTFDGETGELKDAEVIK